MVPGQIIFCMEPGIMAEDEAEKPNSDGESENFCFIGQLRF